MISYVQCHFQSSPSPHKCSPNLSILILDLTVSMINRNISTKIFSVRYVSQVIVPCYYCVPYQPFSAMGNCEESSGKKTVLFFKLKSNNSIYLHQVYKSEYDYLCMSCKYDIFTSFMYVYIIFIN